MACSPQPYQLVIMIVEVPPLRLSVRVALLRRNAALRVISRVHAHRDSGVAYQAALQVSPLLILAAVANLHQQRRALGVYWQRQAEIMVLDETIFRETPFLRKVTRYLNTHLITAGIVARIKTHIPVEEVTHAV